ncbi:MAG: FtsW/RodA/SpoVE family cell cycle protein [Phycisphaerae bacterium]|jgi:cell division protein FtsW (lipid II flippase)|nr:FtsW/RodA/SpoVE family cell cycle protein [Phycisphaerae bacterium]
MSRGDASGGPVDPATPLVGLSTRERVRWTPSELYSEQVPSRLRKRLLWWTPAWLSALAALFLSLLGIEAISTTRPESAAKQLTFLFIGLAAAAVVATPSYRFYRRIIIGLGILVLGLLVFVLLPFVPESIVRPRNGSRSWIALGPMDFQPSELAKTVYILALAVWLSQTQVHRTILGYIAVVGLTLIPIGLIVLEPDLGSALLFLPTMAAMVIAAGSRKRHVIASVVLAAALVPIAYGFVLKPYQRARIDAIIAQISGDTRFEKREGFQGWRAMRLVGSGGVLGVGKQHAGALVTFNGLPEEHNDMIFAVVCCRWGLAGGTVLWGAYLVFAVGGLATAALCRDPFGRLAAVGIVAISFTQMTINTGMTIGLLPITGITLPFVSYGGSSLLATWLNVGLLVNIGLRRPKPDERSYLDD